MADKLHLTINPMASPRLRAGIKWDPLERDELAENYAIDSVDEAEKELFAVNKQISSLETRAMLWRIALIFDDNAIKLDNIREDLMKRRKILKKYIASQNLPSFDLDLCCFCYDANGKMVKYVSPVTTESRDVLDKPLAFMHTGDDDTGTGETFDEEILVNLPLVDENVVELFFVVLSINHGFNQIKGGFWSIVRTADETDLMAAKLQTQLEDRVHVMAKLTRNDSCWDLDEVAEYGSLNENEDDLLSDRIDQFLTARYFSGAPA